MKRIAVLAVSILVICNLGFAQEEKVKKKKNKKSLSDKIWGGYDSNAIDKNLVINDAFVTEGEKLLQGVIVQALVNDKPFVSDTTDKEGGFSMNLKFDFRYILSFTKTGYVTKLVEIDLTNMPIEAKSEGYDLGKFQMGMIRYTEGMDIENYKVPVARYFYDDINQLIQLDRAFFKTRKKQIALVAVANEEVIEDKLIEEDALQEDYNILIRDADIEFEAKDYKLAKEYYLEALKIKPLAEYPRRQINIINGYLEQDLGLEEKYSTLINQGDEAYGIEDYESAKLAYSSAIKIKTTDPYPRERLKKIEEILAAKAKSEKQEEKKVYSLSNVQISNDTQGFSNELAKKYPQGLTIEKYMEGSKSVERRIIVDGEIGVEYKKITHNWGGVYYFKNEKPANHFIWQKEAIQ